MNKKKLLKEAYNKLLQAGFGELSLDETPQFVYKDVMGYGTALDEKIMSLEEFKELISEQHIQAKSFDNFSFTSNPVIMRILDNGNSALVIDEIELDTKINKESNKLFLRLTSLFEFTEGAWMLVHWHGSKPEHISGGEDPWHVDEWKKKTEKLEQMVQEKTAELSAKNNDLKIESSLERVRAVAMGMKKSEDLLSICEVSFKEFQKLGFDGLRNAVIHIPNDEQKYFMDYDYSEFTGGQIGKVDYGMHPIVDEYLNEIRSAEDAFFEVVITDDMLEDWNEFRRKSGQMHDQRLENAKALYYYLFSIGIGDIGISTFKPINESQIVILKKFRNVFDLAYGRYNDITIAEDQTREAQIEAALERVRARAMAMQQSKELSEVVAVLYEQMDPLGFATSGCEIIFCNETSNEMEYWFSDPKQAVLPECFYVKKDGHQILQQQWNAWKRREAKIIIELSGKNKQEFDLFLFEKTDFKKLPDQIKNEIIKEDKVVFSHVSWKYGLFGAIDNQSLSNQKLEILKRFATVFEQTYIRFFDLQKAEMQAKEARIEAALERVRARAMGMHKSEEVSNVSDILFTELNNLNLDVIGASIVVIDEKEDKMELWRARSNVAVKPFDSTSFNGAMSILKKNLPDLFPKFIKALSYRKNYLVDELSGKRRSQFIDTVAEHNNYTDKEKSKLLKNTPQIVTAHYIYFKLGYLALISEKKLSEESLFIARRFIEVFEFSYTRFLDIKKAEAQAREAQVQLALERVRARSMAMHSSNELVEASDVMFNQMEELGIDCLRIGIGTINEENKTVEIWSRSEIEGKVENKIVGVVPYGIHPVFDNMVNAWRENQPYFTSERVGDEVKEYYKRLSKYLSYPLPKKINERESITTFFFKAGSLNVISLQPLKSEECDIMIRFAKVFEQTYTRFLDLKKAEEQAREAQIEMSLERVRNVALQLKKSDEMLDIAQVLYEQLLDLGFKNIRNAIIDIKNGDDDTFTDYDYSHEMSGTITQMSYHDDPTLEGQFKKMATTTNDFFELLLEGKELEDLKAMRIKNGESEDPRLYNIDILTYNLYSFGNGAIGISNFGVLSAEEKSILSRFSNVFTFAYKRYTDLVQAELQAREAQIELSLERIRAKVTAMKESVELLDIVVTMRTEFVNLGHEANYFWYMRYHTDIYEKAMTSSDGTKIGMVMTLPRHIHGDIKLLADWEKSDEPTVVYAMDTDAAVDYVHKMITLGDFKQVDPNAPTLDDIRHIGGLTFIMARTDHGEIGYSLPGVVQNPPTEDLNILIRFAGVFDLAYKRFEDLKNSELRNRETIIALALERVRARTMAMQKSNELAETASHLFTQLNELGINPYRCNIAIVDPKEINCQLWSTTNSGNVIPTGSALPLNEFPVLIEMFDGWKSQRPNHIIKLVGNDRLEWTEYISKHLPFDEYKKKNIDENEIINNAAYFYNFYFKQGFFTIHSKEELEEEHLQVIQRFAYVFEQTYTRFQDLENAEKQNKIIQAENKRKTEELEEARQLQLAMLPKDVPQLKNMDIAVYMKTATEVGGDYYDFKLSSDGSITTVIGDATGHGMKAGTIVTITKSLFNMLADEEDIVKTFHRMSNVIKDMNFRQLSMCLLMAKIENKELTLCSAAMPPALIYRSNNNLIDEYELRGMPLGAIKNFPYKIIETKLHAGDTILLMSDGLPELQNHNNFMYGYERTKSEFLNVGRNSPNEIVEHLKKTAKEWLGNKEPDDDVTFVVIKIK